MYKVLPKLGVRNYTFGFETPCTTPLGHRDTILAGNILKTKTGPLAVRLNTKVLY